MTTFWERYADRVREPSWDAEAVRIRVEKAYSESRFQYNENHSHYVHMAGVFEEAFEKADKKD